MHQEKFYFKRRPYEKKKRFYIQIKHAKLLKLKIFNFQNDYHID